MDNPKMEQLQAIRERRMLKKRRKKRKKIIAAITVAAMTLPLFGFVYTASAKEFTITEINEFIGQNDTRTIKSHANNVEKILADGGMSIAHTDKVNVPLSSEVTEGAAIIVKRGREIKVKTKHGEQIVAVTKADAKEALAEAGIAVGEKDEIKKDANTIELISVEELTDVQYENVPYETKYVEDSSLAAGTTKVVCEGEDGIKALTYNVTLKNGQETGRELVAQDITDAPKNKVIAKGTKKAAAKTVSQSLSSPSTACESGGSIAGHKYTKKITMTATAYSTDPSENGGCSVTAMGSKLRHGIVAVDPKVIPLGSKLYIVAADGSWEYGIASAEDTGGVIKGNKIDLCYEGSSSQVNKFGIRSCIVYVLAD